MCDPMPPLKAEPNQPLQPQAAVADLKRSAQRMNANGVLSQSPGLRHQALPWVGHPLNGSTPKGLRRHRACDRGGTPVGVRWHRTELSQGRRSFLAPTLGFVAERRWRSQFSAAVIRDQIAKPDAPPEGGPVAPFPSSGVGGGLPSLIWSVR